MINGIPSNQFGISTHYIYWYISGGKHALRNRNTNKRKRKFENWILDFVKNDITMVHGPQTE